MIGGDLKSDVILYCHDSSRPISRAHPASARSKILKIFVVYFHKIKSWNLRNVCILVEHVPGVGHTATELVPASGDECYLLIFSWAVSPHVPPPPPRDSIDWCITPRVYHIQHIFLGGLSISYQHKRETHSFSIQQVIVPQLPASHQSEASKSVRL